MLAETIGQAGNAFGLGVPRTSQKAGEVQLASMSWSTMMTESDMNFAADSAESGEAPCEWSATAIPNASQAPRNSAEDDRDAD